MFIFNKNSYFYIKMTFLFVFFYKKIKMAVIVKLKSKRVQLLNNYEYTLKYIIDEKIKIREIRIDK